MPIYINNKKISGGLEPMGIQYDPATDTVIRIGDFDAHRCLPVQNNIKGVILDDLGREVCELPDDDWTSIARDGSLGQVMVRIPEHWMKWIVRNGTIERTWLSHVPRPGFTHIPRRYVSAYQATIDRTVAATPKLASVVNLTASFRGGDNTSSWDNTYRSLLGMPATNTNLTNFRAYARNRNNGDWRWNCMMYAIQRDLFWLFATEYGSFDIQADFNASLDANGLRQGGLGPGVSTTTDAGWNTYNSHNPFIPCGITDTLGNHSGVVSYSPKASDGTSDWATFSVPRFHGIENPYAHLWQWTDGILRETDNTSIYICDKPSAYSSTINGNYIHKFDMPVGNGWIQNINFNSDGDIIVKSYGGGASTRYHDYSWNNNSDNAVHGLHFGGRANLGGNCGLLYASATNVPSVAAAHVGSRLCFAVS